MRTQEEKASSVVIAASLDKEVEKIMNAVDNCIADALKTRNLKDLVVSTKHLFQTD